jgi:hypothetical protein
MTTLSEALAKAADLQTKAILRYELTTLMLALKNWTPDEIKPHFERLLHLRDTYYTGELDEISADILTLINAILEDMVIKMHYPESDNG